MKHFENNATNAESLSLHRFSSKLAKAEHDWLRAHRLEPARTIECELGSEIVAYAGAGQGYGFLPALWSVADHDGVVFAPTDFGMTARVAAYSLKHVTPWITEFRDHISGAARTALRDFRGK